MTKRMDRFWSWLAVTLGKRAGLVSVIGLLITRDARRGDHPARVHLRARTPT